MNIYTNDIISIIANAVAILSFVYSIFFVIIKYFRMYKNKKLFRPECVTEKEVEKYTKIYIQTRLTQGAKGLRSHKFVNNLLKTSNQYHLVLGDTGTGKSAFLLNCYFYFMLKIFRKGYSIYYVSLRDSEALNSIFKIENKKSTILFLDAFDESVYATQNAQEMLTQVEKATKEFAKIVITSRIHFFDKEADEPLKISNMSAIDLEESKYQKYLICPFTSLDIKTYLLKKYKLNIYKQYKACNIIEKCTDLVSRPLILSFIDLLLNNRRYIKYSYEVYEMIIENTIKREIRFVIKSLSDTKNEEEIFKNYLTFLNEIAVKMYYNISNYGEPIVDSDTLNYYDFNSSNKYKKKNRALLERKYNNYFSFSHRSIFEYFIATNIMKIKDFKFDKNLNQTYRFLAEMYDAGNQNILAYIKESPKEWRRNIEVFDTRLAKITYDIIPKNEIIFEFINWDLNSICMQLINVMNKIEYLQNSLCKIENLYAVNRIYELKIDIHDKIQEKRIRSLLSEYINRNNNLEIVINIVSSMTPIKIIILGGYEEVYKV